MVVNQFLKASAYTAKTENEFCCAPLNSVDVKDKINSLRSPHLRANESSVLWTSTVPLISKHSEA